MSYEIGNHPAQAKTAGLGVTSTGKEQVGVEYEFTDGPNKGKRITYYGYFTEQTEERTIESLRISGWTGNDISDLSELAAPNTPVVQLVLAEEEYNGAKQIKVKWVNRIGGMAMKSTLDANAAKAFAAKMKGKVAAFDAKNGKPKPATANGAAPSGGGGPAGDDLPF